jgi:sulfite exporter TauE/SafE
MEPSCCASVGIDPREPLHAALLLTTGLTTSLGHCLGMCGPLQTAVAGGPQPPFGRFAGHVLFHGGRVLTYAAIGATLGLAGPIVRGAGGTQTVQGIVAIAAGLAMLVITAGVRLPGPGSGPAGGIASALVRRMEGLLGSSRASRRFLLGVANGLLPCGPVALVAFAAASAYGPLEGGFAMFLFGLGTIPVLLALAFGAARIGPGARRTLSRVGFVFVLVLASQLILRGGAALGFVPHVEVGPVVFW